MVKKYIIMADSSVDFETPRQLSEVNGEPIIARTIRLLKENGINDIIVTSHDKRFDNLGVERYEPQYNDYIPGDASTYWLNGYPIELLNEPVCFICGDVYFSKNAIKTIVEAETKSTLFFCTYNNTDPRYIKHHDEPLGYKVVDYELFKQKIAETKALKDAGVCCREPVVWELYRVINGIWVNEHRLTKNFIAINDESCDIDTLNDIKLLNERLGENNMIKCEAIRDFNLEKFDELKNVERYNPNKKEFGKLYERDTFECSQEMAEYLTGSNPIKVIVAKVIEVIPEKVVEEPKEEKIEIKPKTTKKSNKKKSKK